MQLQCLLENTLLTPEALQARCTEWLQCLPGTAKAKLKTLLSASLVKRGTSMTEDQLGLSLIESSKLVAKVDRSCFDPANEDPESWDCECLQGMIDTCGGLDEECIKGLMCNNGKVCLTWKQEQCSAAQITSHHASLLARRVHANTEISDNLGEALRGKCSQ